MTPETQTRDRIRAIVSSDLARRMPNLANHLAFDTDQTAEECLAAMRACAIEISARVAPGRLH